MDLNTPETWISALLTALPEEKLTAGLRDDNLQWEYIDGKVAKLGSLTHSQIDIPDIQRQGLELLTAQSKDFRLIAHLVRTLQYTGNHLLAITLLTRYVSTYWTVAWPQNMAHKKRFALQIIKRFETGAKGFAERADNSQRDILSGELAHLAQLWRENDLPELVSATDALLALYQRTFRDNVPAAAPDVVAVHTPSPQTAASPLSEPVLVPEINSHSDQVWRTTLMKVASILCDRQPDSPAGYRLRRHALWQDVTSAPLAENDGRTPLAAFSSDLMADYQNRAIHADMALWQQVEHSLILSPFWFDGHALSARIAEQLGYSQISGAIREEVNSFLSRLPQLKSMLFSDRSPFISQQTLCWLKQEQATQSVSQINQPDYLSEIWQRFHDDGFEAALRYLDSLPADEPRDRFYHQYFGAQLMEKTGMEQLAQQHYRMLFKAALRTTLSDWEPALMEQLEQKLTESL